jgi:phospholipase C
LAFRSLAAAVAALAGAVLSGCGTAPTDATPAQPIRHSIDHVVVVVKENHSFDNYFGSLEAPPLVLPHCPSVVSQARCQYSSADIPAYYQYAQQFSYADMYFTDVRGPSWPNDMMMISAQSPLTEDPAPPLSTWSCPTTCYDLPTIGEELTDAHISWRNYGEELYDPFRSIRMYAQDTVHNVGVPELFTDLDSGGLPAVSWVRPAPKVSEHPTFDIRAGEQWTVSVVDAIMKSRFWSSTAIFITWDDAGDVVDHVSPPTVERLPSGQAFRYGDRVPLLVISPFTRAGTISHRLFSHVSLLKFIEDRFHLKPLTFRDASANSLSEFFDLSAAPRDAAIL